MSLPNSLNALVTDEKVRDYLLAETHPQNKGKAKFFFQIGFTLENYEVLQQALKRVASEGAVRTSMHTEFGEKFVVLGLLTAPNGKVYPIESVWILEKKLEIPRLVTAYPFP
ncbi:DUF6883 domain-containing protein [Larkinella sp. VNQ87]|uniref:DUF6883 domain-containing protein n=1 Tax=Larkinella sp. VNQ87 TaxID=3400921 RepID=UPI003C0E3BA4